MILLFVCMSFLILTIASVSASDVNDVSYNHDLRASQLEINNNGHLQVENGLLQESASSTSKGSSIETSTDSASSSSDKSANSKSSTDSGSSSSDKSANSKSNTNSKSTADSGTSNADKTKATSSKTNVSAAASKNATKITNSGTKIVKGKTYKVVLKDANGKVLSNKKIKFTFGLNKAEYIRTTDANGVASLTINALAGKSYALSYYFLGDSKYSASKGSVDLKVQSKTAISGSGSTITKGNNYKVILKDIDGNVLANKKIVFTYGLSNSTYTRTTDSNGAVTLAINSVAGKAYSLKYKFAGDEYYFSSSQSVNLKVQSKTSISGSGNTIIKGNAYKVTLKDSDGNPLANKQVIFTFGLNGATYTRTTDANGVASLTINAAAGQAYTLKYAFDGDEYYFASNGSVSLKVQSKTSISNSGSTIIKGNAYKVTLKDSEGNVLANKKVVFTFGLNSATYTRTTDKNGVASLTINAAAGQGYTLKYAFAGDDYYLSSSGSLTLKVQSKTSISGSGSSITQGNAYKITLKDSDGNVLANKKVIFLFGSSGTEYARTTDKNGVASLTINAAPGTYKLTYKFEGDTYYLSSSGSVSLKVNTARGNSSQFKKGLNEIESLTDAQLAQYLKASGYDAINSAIQNLANKLTAGKTSTWDKATAIFNYVRDNIDYSYYSNSQKGAAKTLSSGSGNCCDQANLVVALCRAAKIPARLSHAQGCTFSSGLVTGHVWAQIYVDGVWYTADATSTRNSLGNIVNWNTKSFYSLHQYIHLPF